VSLWLRTCGDDLTPRPPLGTDTEADVVVVGAGYTGLWTAYYLATADPTLRVAVVEAEHAGFGASGRNGGWCSALFPAPWASVARAGGPAAAAATYRAMVDTVAEVGRVAATLPLDCGFLRGGTLALATGPAHVTRLTEHLADGRRWGITEADERWLPADEAAARLAVPGLLGAAYTPHCARVQPAALARGLARAVEALGVRVYEGTPALDLRPGVVDTPGGRVRAPVVVRATEAYTALLPGHRRTVVPLYSLMIATEPLPASFWEEVGWQGAETVTDGRNLLVYAQRTADDRIAFGGRGAWYHWGSAVRPSFDHSPRVFDALADALRALFPAARDAAVTDRWGGPLAVPRDWFPSVGLDRRTGLAWAGGYVGDGVATTNLAGRTLADLVLERDTDLVRLPWVGHRSPRWEPEPLRWLGINAGTWLAASADRAEARTGRRTLRGRLLSRLLG
jgi:glycine/D-amino acid oxidase-like deaminating enzyme